jgi:hypothetical protein
LIAGSDFKGVKLALDNSTGMDGIAIPDDVAAECGQGFQVQLNAWTDCKLMRVTPVSIVLGLEVPENWNSVSGAHPLPAGIERFARVQGDTRDKPEIHIL